MMDRKPAASLGRRERKKQEVRRRILRAAAQLFEEKGYEAATVDEITALADVAKGTFFNYFPRKDALLREFGEDIAERVEDELGRREEWRGSRGLQIFRIFAYLGEQVHANPKLFQIILVESTRSLWLEEEEERAVGLRELMRDLLEEGVREGEFGEDVETERALRLLQVTYLTTAVESLRQERSTVAGFQRELVKRFDIIYRGLGGAPIEKEWSGE